MKLNRLIATIALAVSVPIGLAACSPVSKPLAVSSETVIIDVRTAEEYAAGHLDGAMNIDVQSDSFDGLVAQLPLDDEYIVYCRSGNRAGAAIQRMEALGFTDLTNAGGLDAAAASTGLPIVR